MSTPSTTQTSSGKTILAATGLAGSAAASNMTENNSGAKAHTASYFFGNIATLVALFLAFKCKSATGGIDFMQVFIALICSPCYIVYRLAQPCK